MELIWDTPSKIVERYDGIVLGGSSDFFIHGVKGEEYAERAGAREIMDRMRLLVEYIVERQVPTLGICFGHQLIAEVFGGTVTHDHLQKKGGTHEVRLTEAWKDDPLFAGFPAVFPAQYWHRDSVTRPPLGAVVLAEGDSCRFAALRYGSEVYTLQFHPELFPDDLLAHPDIPGKRRRTRIKHVYRPGAASINYWYPPKWGLNERVGMSMKDRPDA